MGKLKIIIIILFTIAAFSACEKDDICIDADTPLLIIRFYDIDDSDEFKDVQNLVVIGLDESGLRDTIPNAALDSIALPLRTDFATTSFTFRRQLDINDSISTDTLTFSYIPREIFASRACGFIVNYDSLQAEIIDENMWIQSISVDSTFIENSAAAHVKIFH